MCTGIALAVSEVPLAFVEKLPGRIHDREGLRELQFHYWERPTVLPVQWDGELRLIRWGNQNRRAPLPFGPWLSEEQLRQGTLAQACPLRVVIPANLGYDRGTWFLIEQGIVGVVLSKAPGGPVVYMLTRPSTNYYRNMAGQCERMPVLVNQLI
jgi:hypothetical protein